MHEKTQMGSVGADGTAALLPAGAGGKRGILYRGDRHLFYEPELSYGQNESGSTYYPDAMSRNGVMFVPVSTVSKILRSGVVHHRCELRLAFCRWRRRRRIPVWR